MSLSNIGTTIGQKIDSISYIYGTETNKLTSVTENSSVNGPYDMPGGTTEYTYDTIGNLIQEAYEGGHTHDITWSVSGKVKEVESSAGTTLSFAYDPTGNRVKKTYDEGETVTTTYYVRDAAGNILATYYSCAGVTSLLELNIFGSSRLGLKNVNLPVSSLPLPGTSTTFQRELKKKYYELTNHLGNVLSVVNDAPSAVNNTNKFFNAKVVTASDYYPFGMLMEDRVFPLNTTVLPPAYRFGFNGKEKDDDINGTGATYDYGARIYDARLGRWLSVDPFALRYPFASPYNFALNTPIQAKDPDGKLVIFVNGWRGIFTDLFDMSGFLRAVNRLFTGEEIYKYDEFDYWGKLDDKFKWRIGDYNVVYADASSHALSTAAYRYERGKEAGEVLLQQINAGEVIIKTGETIKIIAHSQGDAYAAGMIEVLSGKYTIEVIYTIAPKQPNEYKISDKVKRIVQYGTHSDFVAPQSNIDDAEVSDDVVTENDEYDATTGGGHTQGCYHDRNNNSQNADLDKTGIFPIPKGKEGAVERRKDKPK